MILNHNGLAVPSSALAAALFLVTATYWISGWVNNIVPQSFLFPFLILITLLPIDPHKILHPHNTPLSTTFNLFTPLPITLCCYSPFIRHIFWTSVIFSIFFHFLFHAMRSSSSLQLLINLFTKNVKHLKYF